MEPKFKVGDRVWIKGFGTGKPRIVLERWRGKKNRYLLGLQLEDFVLGPVAGAYQIDKLVEEDKLELAREVAVEQL